MNAIPKPPWWVISVAGALLIAGLCLFGVYRLVSRPVTQLLSPVPTPAFVLPKDGMTMVYVEAGEFLMGSSYSDSLANSDEKPQHTIYLDSFWIDRTEVTNEQFANFLNDVASTLTVNGDDVMRDGDPVYYLCSGCDKFSRIKYGSSTFSVVQAYVDHPVVMVTWYGAAAYCDWAGRRLPTEAEWEKAARGTDGRIYPWGDSSPNSNLLNYNSNVGDTTEVGSYPDGASPYGALDMAGNVSEWVADWYDLFYYANSPSENPAGPTLPTLGDERVLRSSSWHFVENHVRAAHRYGIVPSRITETFGFRCARSP